MLMNQNEASAYCATFATSKTNIGALLSVDSQAEKVCPYHYSVQKYIHYSIESITTVSENLESFFFQIDSLLGRSTQLEIIFTETFYHKKVKPLLFTYLLCNLSAIYLDSTFNDILSASLICLVLVAVFNPLPAKWFYLLQWNLVNTIYVHSFNWFVRSLVCMGV